VPLGWDAGYQALTRGVRRHRLRPRCEACAGVRGRDTIEIAHPAGAELQWDWFERRRAPWGGTAFILLGSLSHSGRMRGVIKESMDQAHLVEGIDGVLRRHGGTARDWRTDRLATVIVPGGRDVQASFAPVAKHYGAVVVPCPPRRGNRKGVVEAAVRYLCGRWWRTLTATTIEEAQADLDRFCATVGDARPRGHATGTCTARATGCRGEPALAPGPAPTGDRVSDSPFHRADRNRPRGRTPGRHPRRGVGQRARFKRGGPPLFAGRALGHVGRPSDHDERGRWGMLAFDPSEKAVLGSAACERRLEGAPWGEAGLLEPASP
jgi:hypothetical protein